MGLQNDAFCYASGKNPRPPLNSKEKIEGPPVNLLPPAHFPWFGPLPHIKYDVSIAYSPKPLTLPYTLFMCRGGGGRTIFFRKKSGKKRDKLLGGNFNSCYTGQFAFIFVSEQVSIFLNFDNMKFFFK